MKHKLTPTISLLLSTTFVFAQTKQDSTKYWFANDKITATTMPVYIGVQTYAAPTNSISFDAKDLKTPILTIDMIKDGKIASVINDSGYDSLIVTFSKKRMVWKNDSTFILINK